MLDINIWNFIWSAVNIIILFILLKIFLFKPINKIMDERTRSIQEDIDSAKKSREEAEALKQEYAEDINEAKAEAQKIIMKAHEDAEAEKAVILQKSQEEADQLVSDANKAIESKRKRVLAQAQTQIADLAIEAASKIIGENVDDEKNRRLVDEFLSEEEGGK
ncbi:MAG: F0F1 ATP synthase subunit B [Ruminococcus flavefaciens]|nr:F0F1 ATP synthase subunit B [Ruminococcus flavefaciens]MCM1060014.1 F0F1 ATP synthase subunit B [Eubacterium sp.]MCM1270096.1 F0F1 ATP synthase subunit B [Ruminococcus flavefaciens]MCM1360478.1 F0F1 ATP synthase subunit B [Clostridiales bacterium]MCM1435814.1 F0F1 ATP synthase subunit B [Ruminococcus flavefaciens]